MVLTALTRHQNLTNKSGNITGKDAMLAGIREQLAASVPFDAVHQEGHSDPRTVPARASSVDPGNALDRFREALEAVKGNCFLVGDESQAAETIAQIIDRRNIRRLALSDSPLVRRLTEGLANSVELLHDATQAELFEVDAGITSAQWAIAETGTLVLESEAERHRLASLVPPIHIAVVEAGRILETMGEVLEAIGKNGLSRAVTFITGPSRTSDIELTLAIGVHGPGELNVIVIKVD